MHIHILGICGTFMGGMAQLAKGLGHQVSGCDSNVYPPMSTQLEQAGIGLTEGFNPEQLHPAPDLIVVGNAMSRGNPCVEYMLDHRLPYTSGPQWLGENILRNKHVLSISGTHGKTTTSSMLAKILDSAGLEPGFLIGGVPQNFGLSARLTKSDYFVVEADEYDSAFFDKRSKFVHYFTDTLVVNNLEFDHGDIFDDLAAIQKQFHHCVRTVPSTGTVVYPVADRNVQAAIDQGCWSTQQTFGTQSADWGYRLLAEDGSRFEVSHTTTNQCSEVSWNHSGTHNVCNGVAAIIAAHQVGVSLEQACAALSDFVGVKRRMQVIYYAHGVTVYDDFAHHPTAIKTTLEGLRAKVGDSPIVAVIEPRSATMRLGIHKDTLSAAVADADQVFWYQNPRIDWDINAVADACAVPSTATADIESLLALTTNNIADKSHIVIMSNGDFEGFHLRLIERLQAG
ncbi:MAG: UDP-N-acetylmuramate:L-alanyl-gamma-D-glutamyl-meso-diaminopimelate ligase [Porticoccaceae bacterium]|nr:UDP-N-acetylmuramate:L-alanyl-gamma-D-glutamyl-meso-diaminopimelate ligase [Porticoccaceae bacterium]